MINRTLISSHSCDTNRTNQTISINNNPITNQNRKILNIEVIENEDEDENSQTTTHSIYRTNYPFDHLKTNPYGNEFYKYLESKVVVFDD